MCPTKDECPEKTYFRVDFFPAYDLSHGSGRSGARVFVRKVRAPGEPMCTKRHRSDREKRAEKHGVFGSAFAVRQSVSSPDKIGTTILYL